MEDVDLRSQFMLSLSINDGDRGDQLTQLVIKEFKI